MTYETGLLHHVLDRAVAAWPENAAVTCGGTTLRYAELGAASHRLAGWLREAGLSAGGRLVVHAGVSTVVPALVWAASRAGVAFVLLHEQTPGPLIEHVLADCEPGLLVSDSPAAREAARTAGVRSASVADAADAALSFRAPPGPPPREPLAVDPVCLIYTSGTTSLPKAVVSTHQQVLFAVGAIQSVLGYRSDDIVFTPLPLSFDYGLYQLFLASAAGAHVQLGRPAEAGPPLLDALHRTGATVLPAVPAVAQVLARLLARAGARPPGLRMITNTGAAMPPETLAALRSAVPGLRVHLMFGLTECKRATIMPVDGDLVRPGSSGLALPGTEVLTVGPDGVRLPAGEVGEIVVRGPNVMAGYWRRPDLTALRFPRAEGLFPELRTGDYGWVDDDGYLYFDGRRDDIYKENGFRVSATEVEAAARRVAGVTGAAVLAPTPGCPATLFVTGALAPAQVLPAMREQIEEFKIPRRCLALPELPLTANGKVDRKALSALVEEDGRVRS